MSTSSRIPTTNLGETDRNCTCDSVKTARTVAIRHGAKSLHVTASKCPPRSASEDQPSLTDSTQLRNQDSRQSSSGCPTQSILLSRPLESLTGAGEISLRKSSPSPQRSSLQESFKSIPKRRERRSLQQDKVSYHSKHKAQVEVPDQRDRSRCTMTRSRSSGRSEAEVSKTSKRESRNANHSNSSSDGHSEQCKSIFETARPAVAAKLNKASQALQKIPGQDTSSRDHAVTTPQTRCTRGTPTFATSLSRGNVELAESKAQTNSFPLAQSSTWSINLPALSRIDQEGMSAPQFQSIPLSPCKSSKTIGLPHLETQRASCPTTRQPELVDAEAQHVSRIHTATSKLTTKLDIEKRTLNRSGKDEGEVDLLPLSPETQSASPTSSYACSEDRTLPADYGTPLTSPCVSPIKSQSPLRDSLTLGPGLAQLDGGRDSSDTPAGCILDEEWHPDKAEASHLVTSENAIEEEHGKNHCPIDLTQVDPQAQPVLGLDLAPEDATPLTKACRAKDGMAFPFPIQTSPCQKSSLLATQRHPSTLLRFCERNATPRQQRLMAGTLESPDRFIPGRASTPNKDALLLRKPAKGRIDPRQRTMPGHGLPDPFGPTASRSPRMSDRYATIRTPSAANRAVSTSGTAVPDAVGRRAMSSGAVWTVGGTVVTEGVASITNGRGGRVTSGTNAPHYTADFLRGQSPSEDEIQHGQRLAVAMEVQPGARMIPHSSPLTPSDDSPRRSSCSNIGGKRTIWNNNAWEKTTATTPSKPPKKKTKDIPVIPFRVLDAPALRDDYYCSLLAYSPTAQCLAVSLGPHVYLWSETRGTTPTHMPDSLTAPFGAHVTSVSFSSKEGGHSILAIGRADGRITLWSPQDNEPRFDSEQPAPVSCVSFRPTTTNRPSMREPSMIVATEELLVGDEVGNVYYYSIEWPSPDDRDLFGWHGSMTLLARMSCHTQQICGIAWSKDGDLFATGGNDNQLLLFEPKKLFSKGRNGHTGGQTSTVRVRKGESSGSDSVAGQGGVMAIASGQHKHLFTLNAAVKAIAFAPWQSSLLAAGGGSNDRCIHFFHALSGATLATIDCHAQVTSLVWSETKKEIAATFGFAQPDHPYRVAVFSWPSCQRVVGIPWWSEERALYAVAYPGGPSGGLTSKTQGRNVDNEERSKYGRRTREEGCLVIATSNASIKFHEIWPEKSEKGKREGGGGGGGVLGGSMILEDGISFEVERGAAIR